MKSNCKSQKLFSVIERAGFGALMLSRFCLLQLVFIPLFFAFAAGQTPLRLAVLELGGDENGEFSALLRNLARSADSEFELSDKDLVRAASQGAGYSGSLNLSRDSARALGQSIGCDFYLLGKILVSRRVAGGEQFYYEALAGLFFVESRSGNLALFRFESAKAQTERQALDKLKDTFHRHWPDYSQTIIVSYKRRLDSIQHIDQPASPAVEVLTDDLAAMGVQQPFFYQRIKPDYTEQADLAGITATVELEAVFLDDGTVGDVEVVKWAGFGLDESAISTVKKLRFKPAEYEGKKLTLKGLVRYNFRRPLSQAEKQEELERLKRSLRDIKKVPTQIPGHRPKF